MRVGEEAEEKREEGLTRRLAANSTHLNQFQNLYAAPPEQRPSRPSPIIIRLIVNIVLLHNLTVLASRLWNASTHLGHHPRPVISVLNHLHSRGRCAAGCCLLSAGRSAAPQSRKRWLGLEWSRTGRLASGGRGGETRGAREARRDVAAANCMRRWMGIVKAQNVGGAVGWRLEGGKEVHIASGEERGRR
ncbi:hypothetical protein GALMADRAFT_136348 [Galerina marginata CBS 339.88]|uniref:Uncharacterized protein n=1 Tax=Galerina marginata (strain CBS 339.88) TaxID=685588 RepID=A0A067TII4_GALM3|nr:hypothetical protein GALMADRAFT_136348 [Galerina marginata CBS 339.88]